MCARYSLKTQPDQLLLNFGLAAVPSGYRPRYNIAPNQTVLAIARREGDLRAAELRWGLVPSWADDPSIGARLINARSETVAEKPAFRQAFRKRRCLIPFDGFYEWRHEGAAKVPTYIYAADGRPTAFAGLWETWEKGEEPLHTCTILTTAPNDIVAPIHNRMPVILAPEDRGLWLDPDAEPEALRSLLHPYEGDLGVYAVSPYVNNPRHEGPECVAPVEGMATEALLDAAEMEGGDADAGLRSHSAGRNSA